MLAQIKLLLGITDSSKDSLIMILISSVCNEIINYTHNQECLPMLESTIIEMCLYKYCKLDNAGTLSAENYSGVAYSFTSDYPESILRPLRAYRKATIQ